VAVADPTLAPFGVRVAAAAVAFVSLASEGGENRRGRPIERVALVEPGPAVGPS
jgi:hypothetical protein